MHVSQRGETLESIAQKFSTTIENIMKNNPHIVQPIQTGSLVYLPGMKPPVVTPQSISREDNEAILEKLLPHKLHLINPK